MHMRWNLIGSLAILGAVLVAGEVEAQTTVTYGRITAVRQVDIQNQGAKAAGTMSAVLSASRRAPGSRAAIARCVVSAARPWAAAWRARRDRRPASNTQS